MSLSQEKLRLISTIGMGVLVGTSLIVILPEGVEAVYAAELGGHSHGKRTIRMRDKPIDVRWGYDSVSVPSLRSDRGVPQMQARGAADIDAFNAAPGPVRVTELPKVSPPRAKSDPPAPPNPERTATPEKVPADDAEHESEHSPPTLLVGFSLVTGFILMFLIDKLPRHATETLQQPPPTRHIVLNNLSQALLEPSAETGEEESESFLQSLTPSPKQTRSLATTTGLVIHAAADGIAMGASATTSNTRLGFIVFMAIMIHKAPAAFGLTSVLLKQGLSKRAARGHLIVFSLAAPFGALSTFLLVHILGGGGAKNQDSGQWWTGTLLLFSAGTFL